MYCIYIILCPILTKLSLIQNKESTSPVSLLIRNNLLTVVKADRNGYKNVLYNDSLTVNPNEHLVLLLRNCSIGNSKIKQLICGSKKFNTDEYKASYWKAWSLEVDNIGFQITWTWNFWRFVIIKFLFFYEYLFLNYFLYTGWLINTWIKRLVLNCWFV